MKYRIKEPTSREVLRKIKTNAPFPIINALTTPINIQDSTHHHPDAGPE
jgi:hypothetical protein